MLNTDGPGDDFYQGLNRIYELLGQVEDDRRRIERAQIELAVDPLRELRTVSTLIDLKRGCRR